MRARRLIPNRYASIAAAGLLAALCSAGCPDSQPHVVQSGSTTADSAAGDRLLPGDLTASHGSRDRTSPTVPANSPAADSQTHAALTDVDAPTPAADTSSAAADDVPSTPPAPGWPNFRNGTDLRGIAGTTLPDALELLWELETHDGVTSTAAIDSGRVYVAELSGHVRCLDLHSGQEYWHYRTIESEDPEEFAPGFNAPVTLSDTAVFAGDEDGMFHGLDRATGAELWPAFKTDGEIKGGATVLAPDPATGAPRVMFGSHDGKLYCLNAATGEPLWAFDTAGPVNGAQALAARESPPPNDGSPVVADQVTFVAGCDRPFLRVVDVGPGSQHAEIPLNDSLMIASPALIGRVLYFGTPDGEVIALDWQSAARLWTYSDPQRQQEIHSSPAVTGELVLIGSRDKRLHAINRKTGQGVWTFETRGQVDSSPVVVGERIFFGSADRHVYAVDFRGQEVWKHNAGRRISASPAVGEGHLVIGCEGPGGQIMCFGSMR
jgi:outer membrane protein assembly factor BamB